MRRRWDDLMDLAPIALLLAFVVALVLVAAAVEIWGPVRADQPTTVTVVVPSSVVGGMGMPGKAGSGMQWNREEGTQDEQ